MRVWAKENVEYNENTKSKQEFECEIEFEKISWHKTCYNANGNRSDSKR